MLSLSSNSLPSASCCESYAILYEVPGQTLSNLEGADELSQVDRHWLAPRHRHDHYILDLALHRVDRIA